MIKIFKGSIFDSKCDLLIVPCDSAGYPDPSVQSELRSNYLPAASKPQETGEVWYIPNVGGLPIASVIGYAAFIVEDEKTKSSSEGILRQIYRNIINYCQANLLTKVNIPLLISKSGKKAAVESFKIIEDSFNNNDNILLCVYVQYNECYEELLSEINLSENKQQTPAFSRHPRVFISYTCTGDNKENREWVKNFACRLRKNGVDAHVDLFHLKAGQDLPEWMTNEVIMAEKVILICDQIYAQKADRRKSGVGWETMIIQGDMLSRPDQSKYIAILRDKDIDRSLPIYMKSKYALDWSDDDQDEERFNNLLLLLYDCDIIPPLGDAPDFIKDKFAKD